MKQTVFSKISILVLALLVFILLTLATQAQTSDSAELAASGGTFVLQKLVVAGGGGEMLQTNSVINGTSGQAIAGIRSSGGQFSLYSGFWTPENFTPTAANAIVGGRILTADGRGIKNAQISVTFPSGASIITLSNAFGYYRFADIPVGATYIFSVKAKRFEFSQPSQSRNIVGDTQDINFEANSNETKQAP